MNEEHQSQSQSIEPVEVILINKNTLGFKTGKTIRYLNLIEQGMSGYRLVLESAEEEKNRIARLRKLHGISQPGDQELLNN